MAFGKGEGIATLEGLWAVLDFGGREGDHREADIFGDGGLRLFGIGCAPAPATVQGDCGPNVVLFFRQLVPDDGLAHALPDPPPFLTFSFRSSGSNDPPALTAVGRAEESGGLDASAFGATSCRLLPECDVFFPWAVPRQWPRAGCPVLASICELGDEILAGLRAGDSSRLLGLVGSTPLACGPGEAVTASSFAPLCAGNSGATVEAFQTGRLGSDAGVVPPADVSTVLAAMLSEVTKGGAELRMLSVGCFKEMEGGRALCERAFVITLGGSLPGQPLFGRSPALHMTFRRGAESSELVGLAAGSADRIMVEGGSSSLGNFVTKLPVFLTYYPWEP